LVKNLIVGIDPGTTTGIAILDLEGNILSIINRRDMKISDMIKHILKFGQPLIITSDVTPVPKTVKKIASQMDSRIYAPEEVFLIKDKKRLTKGYSDLSKDRHGKDALAAALKAWKSNRSFFIKVEKELKRRNASDIYEEVVTRLFKGNYDNIDNAINNVRDEKLGIFKRGYRWLRRRKRI
jgi:predicted RNase H-like nuclease (RuvC/YqgF family)